MIYDALPVWAWVVIGWFLASVCVGAACARWFRWVCEASDEHERWGNW